MTQSKSKESAWESAELLSESIDLLRFPLALLVVYAHIGPWVVNLIDANFSMLSGRGIYNIIGIVGSHALAHITVPVFYMISGFLFFYNFKTWSWDKYKRKMRSRFWTLLVPYVLWNLVSFLFVLPYKFRADIFGGGSMDNMMAFVGENYWRIFTDYIAWDADNYNLFGINMRASGPFDLPLWFLRDLIVCTVFTPVIFYAVRKLKSWLIMVLFVCYATRFWTLIPGFSILAFFYFTLGAYFALNELNMVSFSQRYRNIFLPLTAILLVFTTIYDGENTVPGMTIFPFFICSGVFSAFVISSWCIKRYNIKPNKFLVSACFFVYAFHGVSLPNEKSPISMVNKNLAKIIPGSSGFEDIFCYFVAPLLTTLICIAVFVAAKRFFPRITALFSGNR